jgi:hypothetical protein
MTASRIPPALHPWKVKLPLPTISAEFSSVLFFQDRSRRVQRIFAPPAFQLRVRAIKRLTAPVIPRVKGSNLLQAFLWARQNAPDKAFLQIYLHAYDAVYAARRIDGLPRVVFLVSKDVAVPLRGSLKSYLRHQFKRRAKEAFRLTLEALRRAEPGMFPNAF